MGEALRGDVFEGVTSEHRTRDGAEFAGDFREVGITRELRRSWMNQDHWGSGNRAMSVQVQKLK